MIEASTSVCRLLATALLWVQIEVIAQAVGNTTTKPRTTEQKKTLGDRAFENVAPTVRNRLPLEIDTSFLKISFLLVLLLTHISFILFSENCKLLL